MNIIKNNYPVNYPETIIEKHDGVTGSEYYLSKLCNESFLSLWSYPNLFTDQGRKNNTGDGKELCDIFVIFQNHIIIFSDKNCAFKDKNDFLSNDELTISWNRWYKKAIEKSAAQIYKAEEWIKKFPTHIYLNKECTKKFPFTLPTKDNLIIHRIVVAHGISDICKKYTGGDSGSLMINSYIIGPDLPFAVGYINNHKKFVHVLDDFSLNIVMTELDTISDFIKYLEKKELLFNKNDIVCCGEEDLLGKYLTTLNSNGVHDFFYDNIELEKVHSLFLDDGFWHHFKTSPEYILQKKENKISYLWDQLIEKFIFHLTTGTQYSTNMTDLDEQAILFKLISQPGRLERRVLSIALKDFMLKTPTSYRGTRIVFNPNFSNDYAFLFFLFPKSNFTDEKIYREKRQQLLEDYVTVAKLKIPSARYIIGLGLESINDDNVSEDFICLDTIDWNKNDFKEAEKLEELLKSKNLLVSSSKIFYTAYEYPSNHNILQTKINGKNRNKPCPCGSGKKFKKCCGK